MTFKPHELSQLLIELFQCAHQQHTRLTSWGIEYSGNIEDSVPYAIKGQFERPVIRPYKVRTEEFDGSKPIWFYFRCEAFGLPTAKQIVQLYEPNIPMSYEVGI